VGLLLGRLAQATVIVLGFLIAFSIIAPSFHAGDLIKMLGIGSVAIGFAFQNILQNFLAGILILIQARFQLISSASRVLKETWTTFRPVRL
jgi:small conductance mechanosensitive channel